MASTTVTQMTCSRALMPRTSVTRVEFEYVRWYTRAGYDEPALLKKRVTSRTITETA